MAGSGNSAGRFAALRVRCAARAGPVSQAGRSEAGNYHVNYRPHYHPAVHWCAIDAL